MGVSVNSFYLCQGNYQKIDARLNVLLDVRRQVMEHVDYQHHFGYKNASEIVRDHHHNAHTRSAKESKKDWSRETPISIKQ